MQKSVPWIKQSHEDRSRRMDHAASHLLQLKQAQERIQDFLKGGGSGSSQKFFKKSSTLLVRGVLAGPCFSFCTSRRVLNLGLLLMHTLEAKGGVGGSNPSNPLPLDLRLAGMVLPVLNPYRSISLDRRPPVRPAAEKHMFCGGAQSPRRNTAQSVVTRSSWRIKGDALCLMVHWEKPPLAISPLL